MQENTLRHTIIDKVISIDDENLLSKINEILSGIDLEKQPIKVTAAQHAMLKQSDKDIKEGNIVSDEELNEEEDKWLKG